MPIFCIKGFNWTFVGRTFNHILAPSPIPWLWTWSKWWPPRCSTCPLVLAVASCVMWFFSSWERKNCLQSWTNSQNDHSKRQPRTIVSGNNCHFFNLLCFASSSFFISLTKITWLDPQQPKTWGHVEHLSIIIRLRRDLIAMHSFYWNLVKISLVT